MGSTVNTDYHRLDTGISEDMLEHEFLKEMEHKLELEAIVEHSSVYENIESKNLDVHHVRKRAVHFDNAPVAFISILNQEQISSSKSVKNTRNSLRSSSSLF